MYNKSTGKKIALWSELQTKEDKPNDLKLSIKTLEKSNLTLSVENAKLKTELIRYQVENQSLYSKDSDLKWFFISDKKEEIAYWR